MPPGQFDPSIWGPHYWFFLHTIAQSYPANPSPTMQKKYYNFYQDLPIFIPVESIGNSIAEMLDHYPVTSYLDSRSSLVKWTVFIHNKVNEKLGKDTVTREEASDLYDVAFKPKGEVAAARKVTLERSLYAYASVALILGGLALHEKK